MAGKRKTVTLLIFSFCFLLGAYALYQIFELVRTSDNSVDSNYGTKVINQNKKENEITGQVTLQWDPVPNAISYNIYWSTNSGVNKINGKKIENAMIPTTIRDLKAGSTYYFVVTAINETGESEISKEISHTIRRGKSPS